MLYNFSHSPITSLTTLTAFKPTAISGCPMANAKPASLSECFAKPPMISRPVRKNAFPFPLKTTYL